MKKFDNFEAAKQRAEELQALIALNDNLYYNLARPELTDAQYDDLFSELRAIEAAFPALQGPNSPTQRVGAALPKGGGFSTAAHTVPMLSIESLFTAAEVGDFDARVKRGLEQDPEEKVAYVAEPKYDGVSANLVYEAGHLVLGLTRGDGRQGENITANLKTIRSIPLQLLGPVTGHPTRVEIRGEVLLSRQAFTKLQERGETTTATPFRNPRNAVAGSLKRLDPAEVAERGLDFVAWGIGDLQGVSFSTYHQLITAVGEWGFKTSPQIRLCASIAEVLDYHGELEAQRETLPFEMDGMVAKVNQLAWQEELGRTARTPRWVLAYKFAPRRAETLVKDILVQVGRVGTLTPVAELEPVEISGVTVQRATLHNEEILKTKGVRVGDTVIVERAGDVIPAVVEVIADKRPTDSQPFTMPTTCPVCASSVVREGVFSFCSNISCPAQIRARILHLSQRRALDIDRLGPKYVDQLMAADLLTTPADVFFLADYRETIMALPRWGEKSYINLIAQIDRAKTPDLARFFFALGIRGVGETTGRDLAEHFDSLDALGRATEEELQEIDGIGPEVSRSLINFFALPTNQNFLSRLAMAGVTPQAPPKKDGALKGTIWCFTGKIAAFSRDQARDRVEKLGGKTANSISKKVTHLVTGPGAGTKLEKAKKLEIQTLTEEDFLEIMSREEQNAE